MEYCTKEDYTSNAELVTEDATYYHAPSHTGEVVAYHDHDVCGKAHRSCTMCDPEAMEE